MKIYDEFCSRMNEVKDLGWKKSWGNSIGLEKFCNYSSLAKSESLKDISSMGKMIGNYTGFFKVDNKFLPNLGVFHPCDFLYFERGKLKYSQGVFLNSEDPINKSVFYDNNFSVERSYDINFGMLLSRISRRVSFEEDDYKMMILQDFPDYVNFYVMKKNSGVINFKLNENSETFVNFKSGIDKNWKFKHFFNLVKNCDSSFYEKNGERRLDLPFSESVSLLNNI